MERKPLTNAERARALRDAAACVVEGSARIPPLRRVAIAAACEELARELEKTVMFPRYRVYVEFDGLDAKEQAEVFRALMQSQDILTERSTKHDGLKAVKRVWRISEERED